MIFLLFVAPTTVGVSALTNLNFGGKSGDWIEYNLQGGVFGSGEQQERIDFLNVYDTNVTVQATYTPSLPGMDNTETFDLTAQDDFPMAFLTVRVYFIPGGLNQGDSVYLGNVFGMRNITGETTKSFAGVSRGTIYANFSDAVGNNYILYWDKQTGVLTEGAQTFGVASYGVTFNATNMWGAELAWLLWISVIAAVALGILSSRKGIMKRLHKKRDVQPSVTKVASLHRKDSL